MNIYIHTQSNMMPSSLIWSHKIINYTHSKRNEKAIKNVRIYVKSTVQGVHPFKKILEHMGASP
jgi:S-adenosylmethionine synthetase